MPTFRIGMAQVNSVVGDLDGNARKICSYIDRARGEGVQLLSFPEMALTGYPPEDLLLKESFIDENLDLLETIVEGTEGITAVVGFVDRTRAGIHNAAAVIRDGLLAGVYHKMLLPNYGVFDEMRYFKAGTGYPVFVVDDVPVGVNICEDIWHPDGPTRVQVELGGARLIMNINASPYHQGKWRLRERVLLERVRQSPVAIAYNNMVGGQDGLVFDGHGMVVDGHGQLVTMGRQFEEDLVVADLDIGPAPRLKAPAYDIEDPRVDRIAVPGAAPPAERPPLASKDVIPLSPREEVLAALTLGTSDYVRKNGFERVVIGLSGGIDSALTAAIAVDALGADAVSGVYMPSRFSSAESEEDARGLAANLGIRFTVVPIDDIFAAYLETLAEPFEGLPEDVTEENIQARIRGNVLMALSNKFGDLVLSTGNKSETSVGYCTLYGDMAGGFAVIKDVPKTLVYELAREANALKGRAWIPERTIEREPTAELRLDQRDTDSLPPYEVLDPILDAYVEEDRSLEEIVAMGFDAAVVERVMRMVDRNEYKRRQSPPGLKITERAFGKDRRMPITNRYRAILADASPG